LEGEKSKRLLYCISGSAKDSLFRKFSLRSVFVVFVTFFFIFGCQPGEQIEGFILEVGEESLLLAEGATKEEYNEWKNVSYDDLMEMRPGPSLLMITYEETKKLSAGDYVVVTIDGDIAASYPGQAKAKAVEKVD